MRENITEKIEIPEGVEVTLNHGSVNVSGNGNENEKHLNLKNIDLRKEGSEIVIESKKAGKNERKMLFTIKAHLKNMMKGINEKFIYQLEIAYVHFPMTVELSGDEIVIKNFLGEKKNRGCSVLKGTEVEINGKDITVSSHNKELAGQMAANLEKATRVKGKDRRKFQDGIYMIEKPGRKI